MEQTVLGIVWQIGPCTTYAVMRELSASSSTYYRNRAGTTYPIVERLVKSGLLDYGGDPAGPRKDRLVHVTEAGKTSLALWLDPPIPQAEIGQTRDLLRLRIYFLSALAPAKRKEFLRQSRMALVNHLAACEEACREHQQLTDPFVSLADLGAVYETKARIAWIDEITPTILGLK